MHPQLRTSLHHVLLPDQHSCLSLASKADVARGHSEAYWPRVDGGEKERRGQSHYCYKPFWIAIPVALRRQCQSRMLGCPLDSRNLYNLNRWTLPKTAPVVHRFSSHPISWCPWPKPYSLLDQSRQENKGLRSSHRTRVNCRNVSWGLPALVRGAPDVVQNWLRCRLAFERGQP